MNNEVLCGDCLYPMQWDQIRKRYCCTGCEAS